VEVGRLFLDHIRIELRRPPTTNIYFARCSGLVKIGKANCVETRMRNMQAGNPFEIELLASFPGTYALETAIHHALQPLRQRGEWFEQGDDLTTVLDLVRSHFDK
jgi:hypothetical protein